jgi:hypothetical protein
MGEITDLSKSYVPITIIQMTSQELTQSLTSASEIATGLNAAEAIFKLIDYPSKINALKMDTDETK